MPPVPAGARGQGSCHCELLPPEPQLLGRRTRAAGAAGVAGKPVSKQTREKSGEEIRAVEKDEGIAMCVLVASMREALRS